MLIYCCNHFAKHTNNIIILHTFKEYDVKCRLYLNKTGGKDYKQRMRARGSRQFPGRTPGISYYSVSESTSVRWKRKKQLCDREVWCSKRFTMCHWPISTTENLPSVTQQRIRVPGSVKLHICDIKYRVSKWAMKPQAIVIKSELVQGEKKKKNRSMRQTSSPGIDSNA